MLSNSFWLHYKLTGNSHGNDYDKEISWVSCVGEGIQKIWVSSNVWNMFNFFSYDAVLSRDLNLLPTDDKWMCHGCWPTVASCNSNWPAIIIEMITIRKFSWISCVGEGIQKIWVSSNVGGCMFNIFSYDAVLSWDSNLLPPQWQAKRHGRITNWPAILIEMITIRKFFWVCSVGYGIQEIGVF